ncbi:MAG: sulfurtransferase complex subunit TusB [Kangiellaceae bacterium]|nr:sulfurtransferase complex subunit TusB [Kangiellaceae bacterium]
MKSLFILNNPTKLDACLNAMSTQDGLLLIEDAVIATHHSGLSCVTYALEEDLIARGLSQLVKQHLVNSNIKIIDYTQFVELTLQYDKTVSWL